ELDAHRVGAVADEALLIRTAFAAPRFAPQRPRDRVEQCALPMAVRARQAREAHVLQIERLAHLAVREEVGEVEPQRNHEPAPDTTSLISSRPRRRRSSASAAYDGSERTYSSSACASDNCPWKRGSRSVTSSWS